MIYRALIIFFVFLSSITSDALADTIILTTGNKIKGLIVDEYVDRIVVSTFRGEMTILRESVKSIQYEDEETRLLKLGGEAAARGKYKNAIYYYQTVLKLNPNSAAARDGEISAARKQLGSGAEKAEEEINLMVSLGETGGRPAESETASYESNAQNLLGLKLSENKESNICYVNEVIPGSVAADYGVRKNDVINAVWNDSAKYMTYEEVVSKLSGPEFSMIKLSLERKAVFLEPQRLKWDIGIREAGYFVNAVTGLSESEQGLIIPGDWVLKINSSSTRYMPKGRFNKMLSDSKKPLVLLIKRDLYMTREKRR